MIGTLLAENQVLVGVYKPNHDVRYNSVLKVSRNIAVKAAGVGKMVVGLTSSIKMGGKHEEASNG